MLVALLAEIPESKCLWELDERVADGCEAEGAVDSQYVSLTRFSMT